ncbi:PTS ascorbate transporter subunit IIC, partial [Enterococcus sp. S181_ASV_20]|nr:PTS ascorbate transporter subunit IIC [Enterococcus sp. S181_ASV_20]
IGMFDWATAWPIFTVIMKVLGYVGIAVVVLGLLIIPQLQYRKNPDGYFMIVDDYEQYAEKYQEQ